MRAQQDDRARRTSGSPFCGPEQRLAMPSSTDVGTLLGFCTSCIHLVWRACQDYWSFLRSTVPMQIIGWYTGQHPFLHTAVRRALTKSQHNVCVTKWYLDNLRLIPRAVSPR